MYLLRDDEATQTLRIEMTGDVTTAEATRALSQAFALAAAGGRSRVLCDLAGTEHGPDELAAVASLLRTRPLALRIAFVGGATQLQTAVRLAKLAGAELVSGVFSNSADADAWLDRAAIAGSAGMPGTTRRHLQHSGVEMQPRMRAAGRAEPAA